MRSFNALACAGWYRLAAGEWLLHSRFTQAINYSRSDGELLTVFRHGKGVGPMGLVLSARNFSHFADVTRVVKCDDGLIAQGRFVRVRRELLLRSTPGAMRCPDLSLYCQPSGLCGPLNQLRPCPQLQNALAQWFSGETPDLRQLIGRGPGLTPSGDDMLTGMLAVLFASHYASQLLERVFLPPVDQLMLLTTSVSCSYLNSARRGEFSTTVLRVLRSLQAGGDPQPAIQRLLSVGHTSGADILVGMVMALQGLHAVDLRWCYARSGDNSHIY